MAQYQPNHWTKSTKTTLEYINDLNLKGIRPKLKDLPTGTMQNWVYALKKEDYITNGNGLTVAEKGQQLLKQLQNTHFERRGRKAKKQNNNKKFKEQPKEKVLQNTKRTPIELIRLLKELSKEIGGKKALKELIDETIIE